MTDILNKTWTYSDSEENLSEEIFTELQNDTNDNSQIMNHMNITLNKTSPEFLLKSLSFIGKSNNNETVNLGYNDLSMRSSYTSFSSYTNLSPKSTTFNVRDVEQYHALNHEYRSLNPDIYKQVIDIDNMFDKICNMECVSLFDENTNGLDFDNGDPISTSNTTKSPPKKKQTSNINNLTVNVNPNNLTVDIGDTTQIIDTPMNTTTDYIILKPTDITHNITHDEPMDITQDNDIKNDQVDQLELPVNSTDNISIPNSFDMFVDDLKHSTSIPLDSPNDFTNYGKTQFNLLNPTLKMMTSSVDKDLNNGMDSKDVFKNKLMNHTINKNLTETNLLNASRQLTSSNFDLNEIQETSSPFRPLKQKTSLNSSYTINKKLIDFSNRRSDININENNKKNSNSPIKKPVVIQKRNKFDSNESLNDNDETSSKSSSSNQDQIESNDFQIQFNQFGNDDLESNFLANQTDGDLVDIDLPRTVFNQTYTSWEPTEDQLQIDAFKQQKAMEGGSRDGLDYRSNVVKPANLNLTQSLESIDLPLSNNLNRTMDIEDENNHAKENLNRTREIDDSEENLNKTREIIEDDDEITNFVKSEIEIKPKSSKRLSLASQSGYIRPNIEIQTSSNKDTAKKIEMPVITRTKLPSPPKKTLIQQPQSNFEFKKPEIPKLPRTSLLPKTNISKPTIPKPSFSTSSMPKPKTLSVNTSTSNILKTSTTKILTTQNSVQDRTKMRASIAVSSRLPGSSTESSKENNGVRSSMYVSNKLPVNSKTMGVLKPPTQVSKSLKVNPTAGISTGKSSQAPQVSSTGSKIALPTKSMIPSFKTSALPVSKIGSLSKIQLKNKI